MYQQKQQPRRGWEKYDKLLYGILIGVVIPFVGLAFLMLINEEIAALRIETQNGIFDGLSERLIRLLAVCLNLIPFTLFQRRKMDKGLRGIVIPTIIYAMIWLTIYSAQLIGGR